MLNKIEIEQGTDEWLELRKGKITGTLIPLLQNGSMTAYKKFAGLDTFTGNRHTERGTKAESLIRDLVEIIQDKRFTECVYGDDVFLGSLDGLSEDGTTVLEIKCPESEESAMYKTALKGDVPKPHMLQMQFYMWLTGAGKGVYVVAPVDEDLVVDKKSMLIIDVDKDAAMIDDIIGDSKNFLAKVESGHFVGSNSLDLDETHNQLSAEFNQCKEKEKELKLIIAELGDGLKAYGPHQANNVQVFETKGRETVAWRAIAEELAGGRVATDIVTKHTKTGDTSLSIRVSKQ